MTKPSTLNESRDNATHPDDFAALRRDVAEGFAAFDRGEGIETTPDAFMDGILRELALTP